MNLLKGNAKRKSAVLKAGDKVLKFGRDDLNRLLKNPDVLEVESVDRTVVKLTNGTVCDISSVCSIDKTCEALRERMAELQIYIDQLTVLDEEEAEEYTLDICEDEEDTRSLLEKLSELEKLTSTQIDLNLNHCRLALCEYPENGLPKSVLTKIAKLGFAVVNGRICTN